MCLCCLLVLDYMPLCRSIYLSGISLGTADDILSTENLYLVDFNDREAQLSTCLLTKSSMGWLWHRRLGHIGMKQLNKLIKHDLVRGLKDVTFEKDKLCSACQAGKQVGNTHPKKSMMSTSKAFELMHMDLFDQPHTLASVETSMDL